MLSLIKCLNGLATDLPSLLKFELELYKKLWNFFLIGDSYYFIINHHNFTFEFVSKEVENVMGYLPSEFDIPFMNGKLHPDDRSWFLAFGDTMVDFSTQLPVDKLLKYKVRYDIRFRKKMVTMPGYFTREYCL